MSLFLFLQATRFILDVQCIYQTFDCNEILDNLLIDWLILLPVKLHFYEEKSTIKTNRNLTLGLLTPPYK